MKKSTFRTRAGLVGLLGLMLLAPIAVGRKSRRGAQVVLHDAAYDSRHPIVEHR